MDAPTISAFAATAAAAAAATVAGIQFFVGYRQSKAALIAAQAAKLNAESSGRHTVAAFRQKWIECVRETLSEYHSIFMSADPATGISPDDKRKLAALKMKLELILNPEEPESQQLLSEISSLRFQDSAEDRKKKDEIISRLAHKILKTEWVRIKGELQ